MVSRGCSEERSRYVRSQVFCKAIVERWKLGEETFAWRHYE
jgi:hypothetical protein